MNSKHNERPSRDYSCSYDYLERSIYAALQALDVHISIPLQLPSSAFLIRQYEKSISREKPHTFRRRASGSGIVHSGFYCKFLLSKCKRLNYTDLFQLVLGACTKLPKATIRFVTSVRPSVSPSVSLQQLGSHWTDFHDISYLRIFLNSVEKIRV